MGDASILNAIVLGFIEGLTEFIPVSSTAHVLLASHFLGFKDARQHLRGADPARRDPRHPVGLCPQADRHRAHPALLGALALVRGLDPDRLPAGRRHRRRGA